MAERGYKNSYTPLSDINVTPFVDVLLVLLVIFMITAPMLTASISIKLPEENVKNTALNAQKEVNISVDRRGGYYLESKKVSLDALLGTLEKNSMPEDIISIRADERTRYKAITTLMAALRRQSFVNINLVVLYKE